jgi:hypothetical protein
MLLLLRTGGSALKSGLLDERSGSSATLMRSCTAGGDCTLPAGAAEVPIAATPPPEEVDADDEG